MRNLLLRESIIISGFGLAFLSKQDQSDFHGEELSEKV